MQDFQEGGVEPIGVARGKGAVAHPNF